MFKILKKINNYQYKILHMVDIVKYIHLEIQCNKWDQCCY